MKVNICYFIFFLVNPNYSRVWWLNFLEEKIFFCEKRWTFTLGFAFSLRQNGVPALFFSKIKIWILTGVKKNVFCLQLKLQEQKKKAFFSTIFSKKLQKLLFKKKKTILMLLELQSKTKNVFFSVLVSIQIWFLRKKSRHTVFSQSKADNNSKGKIRSKTLK